MTPTKIAIIGAGGWMGRIHAAGYMNIPYFFGERGLMAEVVLAVESAEHLQAQVERYLPNARFTTNWRDAIEDPGVELVDICLPDNMHYEVARTALLAGKHVFCEKPLTSSAGQARELADIAKDKNLRTRVGHAFPRNPVHDLAHEIISSGEIGKVTLFRGSQHVDTFGDPEAPFVWRADGNLAPTGIVGDTGSHLFSFMCFLVGRTETLLADNYIIASHRPRAAGTGVEVKEGLRRESELAEVTNPDGTNMVCRFECGARGSVNFSRIATGKGFEQTYEIFGTRGSITFDYREMNRLHLYSLSDREGRRGYRAIDVGPENANFAAFLPLRNLGLGYNETKFIEMAEMLRSIATGQDMWPTFEDGHHICQMVDACIESSRLQNWVNVAGMR